MPLPNYAVLKGRPIDRRLGAGQNPHYQVRIVANNQHFRIAINVRSKESPSDLLYFIDERFQHPILDGLDSLAEGLYELPRTPTGGGLDFIRGNLFDPFKMVPLPFNVPGPDNDLNEKFDSIIQRALSDESAVVHAFGAHWGPEPQADKYFGFAPGRGIHEIHMNQGNSAGFRSADGVWQDGGLIVKFPEQQQWIAVFTGFQSQAWHTNDHDGHALPAAPPQPGENTHPNVPTPNELPTESLPDGIVRIVGALINTPESPEHETVTVINTSNREIALAGWNLADKQKAKMPLSGKLPPGGVKTFPVQAPVALSNKGGIITLLDDKGRKIHGVSYTKEQASHVGWTVVF